VAIWTLRLEPGAVWTLPPAANPRAHRTLYFFEGDALKVADHLTRTHQALVVRGDVAVRLEAVGGACELLMLQGRPIGQPVVQYGPFVMNSRAEIQQAFNDYQRTGFGGWPWRSGDPVHPREEGRFARHADGRIERPSR
jgi:hypothetical protein